MKRNQRSLEEITEMFPSSSFASNSSYDKDYLLPGYYSGIHGGNTISGG